MYWKTFAGTCAAGLALVVSCSIDSRKLSTTTFDGRPGLGSDASIEPGVAEGLSTAPRLLLEPAALDLGQAVVGVPSRGRIAVINTGNAPLVPSQVAMLTGSDPDFLVLHDQCEGAIGPAERCEVRIQLMPGEPGLQSANLGVDASGQSARVSLSGVALQAGPLIVAPAAGSSGDLGGVVLGGSAEVVLEVSNPLADTSGPLDFVVNESQFQLLPPAAGDCQPGVTALANGQSCRIRLAFVPIRRGATDGLLVVTSSNLGSTGFSLTGTGRLPAALVMPDRVEFGRVVLGGTGQRTLQLENQGDEPITLSSLTLADAAPDPTIANPAGTGSTSTFSLRNSDCGAGRVLTGGASCSVTAAFRPQVAQLDQQGELLVGAIDGTQKRIALNGSGLAEGTLRIVRADDEMGDFGALPIGDSATRTFVITNPSAQPSGPLDFEVFDDFALEAPSGEGGCESGVTTLVDGQTCSVAVTFIPTRRGQHDGALTVGSALAGGAHLPLGGRGLELARLEFVRSEIDFGRVPEQTPIRQVVAVRNAGDQPIRALQAILQGPVGGAAAGFTIQSGCPAELAGGAACDIGIQFLPNDAVAYSAVLRLSSDSAVASALLLGRAFPRGNLTITPLDGSGDFGDVELGTERTIQCTLANGGQTPSGRLTIASANNLFTLTDGDCNLEAGVGLGPAEDCTFSLTFAPTTSEQVVGNLSIQSPGAGETGLTLSGRGRSPPNLTATNNRDLGLANVGQQDLREPANQFTWTVTNEGDLDSGVLRVANSNGADFVTANDTCSDAVVVGGGTCTMDIRFSPVASGPRSSTLTVTDTLTSQLLTLTLTGTAVAIAQLGQSCVNAECATGTCTGGVCCDRDCIEGCQVCDPTGLCVDQSERQPCGNGNGQCFGVNQCLLPETQPCVRNEECGAGNCEQRLGGQGPNDTICCLADCDAVGQQCDPQTGQCQMPTLGAGMPCGSPGQAGCADGLECKSCRGGGNQCTPINVCCGGCAAGYECINGDRCGCPVGSNGLAQIDCGNGQCILDRQNACCPVAPDCPANLPVCDGSAGLCRQCMVPADCAPGPAGTVASCFNFACNYSCGGGLKDCGGTRCVQSNQCCGNLDCGPCETCSAQGFCQSACTPGQQCNPQNNTCFAPAAGFGQTCSQQQQNCTAEAGLVCGSDSTCQCDRFGPDRCNGRCVDTQSDPANCGVCGTSCGAASCFGGRCNCSDGEVQGVAGCGFGDGAVCASDSECANGQCTTWFQDIDGDEFGGSIGVGACGVNTPPGIPLSVGSFVARGGDCCDIQDPAARLVNPGAALNPAEDVPESCRDASTPASDHNCDGQPD